MKRSWIILFFLFLNDCKKAQCFPLAPVEVEIPSRFFSTRWIVMENGTNAA